MNEQMSMKRIEAQDFARIEKDATEKTKARNRAESLIKEAIARYVKEKTRARSKKAALEKDAAIHAPRFNKLAEYDRKDDIREAYGIGYITESQADKLEDLWDEREKVKSMSTDGVYSDLVTECLTQAKTFVAGMFEDEITEYELTKYAYDKQCAEDQKQRDEMHEDYKAWKNGWGKYYRGNNQDPGKGK